MPATLNRWSGVAKLDLKGPGLSGLPALPEGAWAWALGPAHLLLTCATHARETVIARVDSVAGVWVTDVTPVYAHFLITGEHSREVLHKVTSLNISGSSLPELACAQTRIAHVPAILLRLDNAFHVLVSREYGESVWAALRRAGGEFEP